MNKTIFVTTSIPYVNSRPHVGHAQEFIIADCIARIYRALQFEVIFQSGTDENAFKNVVAAASEGISVQELVDKNAVIFRNLLGQLNISIDTFIRTTEPRHRRGVELFWSLVKRDDLYAKSYDGLYCIGCEDFFLQKDLAISAPDYPDQVIYVWIDALINYLTGQPFFCPPDCRFQTKSWSTVF